eukprot:COSAG06_NODE_4277_length_4410_cov_5.807237_2_plen_708_part_00
MVPVNPVDESVEATSPSRARRSGSPPARASSRRRFPSTYSSAAVGGAGGGEYRQLVAAGSPQGSLAGEPAALDAGLALSIEPAEGEKQRQSSSAVCGCCIGGDGDNGEEEALVLPPTFDFGGRLGPWLSTPEGAPTALSYVLYGTLGGETVVWLFFGYDGRGIFNMLGCDGLGSCSLDDVEVAAQMAFHLGGFILLAAYTFVFHALRCVTRTAEAGGQLVLLGLGIARVPTSAARSLRQWRLLVRLVTWPVAVAFVGMAVQMALVVDGAQRVLFPLVCVTCATGGIMVGQWWLTLQLAVALTNDEAKPVAAAAEAAAKREAELDDGEWRRTIEEPAQKLACVTLPLLSEGWGPSLGAVMIGFFSYAIGLVAHLYELPQFFWDDPALGPLLRVFAGLTVVFAALPVLLALAPAGVSTACDELTDSLTDLHAKGDPARQYERMTPLETILDRANRKQGIGFRIGRDTVLDKKTLYSNAVRVYALVVAAETLLLSSLEAVPEDDPLCLHGWSRVGGSCMKVFHEEPQTWPVAESVCEGYGGHLASIGSQVENDAVNALVRSVGDRSSAWIGLTDAAEEGTFVWSDGAPLLDFYKWGTLAGGQPNNDAGSDQCGSYSSGEDCVAAVPGLGWFDDPCEAAGADWFAKHALPVPNEPPDQHGCYPVKFPFVCSKPAQPGTTALSCAPTAALYTSQQQRYSYCCAVLCCAVAAS